MRRLPLPPKLAEKAREYAAGERTPVEPKDAFPGPAADERADLTRFPSLLQAVRQESEVAVAAHAVLPYL